MKTITKKIRLTHSNFILYQLLIDVVLQKGIILTKPEIDILVNLSINGEVELGLFCNELTKKMYDIKRMEEFSVKSQNIRNIIGKLERKGLIEKTNNGGIKKYISISSDIELHNYDEVLLNYQFLFVNASNK